MMRTRFQLDAASFFDLPYRAGFAINPMTSLLDDNQRGLPYFDATYGTNLPIATHIRWDYGDCVGRYLDALSLARIMSGSREGEAADGALEKWAETLIGPHGLSWWPAPCYSHSHPADPPGRVAELTWTQRSAMNGFITRYQVTGEERYARLVRGIVDGLSQLAIWKDDVAYYPRESTEIRYADVLYPPSGWTSAHICSAGWFGAIIGVVLQPLARFFALTGYEPALKLANGLARYILRETELYRPDGRFHDQILGHFYARTTTAGGILRLGVLTGNREYVQLAERIYAHAREWGTSFGWFPEDLSKPFCETCCIKDVIEFAIGLAMHVNPKYWDDVERFGRNHLLESQLTRIDWVEGFVSSAPTPSPGDADRITRDRVMERSLGGFAGWSGVNDWVGNPPQMMACCHASGARALYDLWHYGATTEDDLVSINLLFSRATRDVAVRSCVPFEGRVEIRCRDDRLVRLRIPGYVRPESIRLSVRGNALPARLDAMWLRLPALAQGDVAKVTFDLPERRETVHLGYNTYEVTYRGDTVVAISPRGTVFPLYERDMMRSAAPPPEFPTPPSSAEIDCL